MRILKIYLLLSYFGCLKITAQEVIIQPPIFTSLECTEFFKLFTGTILNFSGKSYDALLYVEVDYSRPNGAPARLADGVFEGFPAIDIPENTTVVNSNNYELIYPQRRITFYDREIEDLLSRTKCLPPGRYDVCLTLYPADATSFDDNFIAQTCYERDKVMLNQLFLVSPFENDEILVDLPLFTWTAILPFNPDAMYRIQIVEVLANQTPFEAFRSNPIFFEESRLRTNIFQYPVPARTMLPCTKYAWRVIYELDSRFIESGFLKESNVFQQSEIWTFTKPCKEEEDEEEKDLKVNSIFDKYHNLKNYDGSSVISVTDYQLRLIIDNAYNSNRAFSYLIIDEDGLPTEYDCCWICCAETESSDDEIKVSQPREQRKTIDIGSQKLKIDLDELGLKTNVVYTLRMPSEKETKDVKFKIKL